MIWDRVFKNGPSKICGRQLLKNLKGYGLLKHLRKNLACNSFLEGQIAIALDGF